MTWVTLLTILIVLLARSSLCTCPNTTGWNGTQCIPCTRSFCVQCSEDYTQCTYCSGGYGATPSSGCFRCFSGCDYCWTNKDYCDRCATGYGIQPISSIQNNCLPCSANCIYCNNLYSNCTQCTNNNYFLQNGQCYSCNRNVSMCQTCTSTQCTRCSPGYVLDSQSCISCSGLAAPHYFNSQGYCYYCYSYCLLCNNIYGYCTLCNSTLNFGAHPNLSNSCYACRTNCLTCSGTDFTFCTSCKPAEALMSGTCYNCVANCKRCSDNITCDQCSNGYYLKSNDMLCYQCPTNCSLCIQNSNIQIQCTQCIPGLFEIYNLYCRELCGDNITYQHPCDNQLNETLDGCNDTCFIQPGFNCTLTTAKATICSYIDPITVTLVSFFRQKFTNEFTLTVRIQPPLYIFKAADSYNQLKQLFTISNEGILVKNITYNISTGQLTFIADFTKTIDINLTLTLNQSVGYSVEFHSSFEISLVFYYYPPNVMKISKIINYYCYVLTALGWLAFILGIFLRKLAGLEAMFVLQYSWLIMLWLNSVMLLPYEAVLPLKYSSGYNHPFISNAMIQQKQNPYFFQFQMSKQYFIDNFNLSLIFPLLALFFVLFSYIRAKCFIKYKESLKKQERYSDQVFERLQTFQSQHEQSLVLFMHVVMFNLIYFSTCSLLYFKYTKNILQFFSLVSLALGLLFLIILFLRFHYNSSSFLYFATSFRSAPLASRHYYLHTIVLCSSVLLLGMLTTLTQLALIPCSLMVIYTLAYKPYSYPKENYRSAFNYLVMCSWIVLKILIQKFPLNSPTIFTIYIVNVFALLTFVVIISFISIIYYNYYQKEVQPKESMNLQELKKQSDKFLRDRVLEDLTKVDFTRQVTNLTSSIFKKAINQKQYLLQFINKNRQKHGQSSQYEKKYKKASVQIQLVQKMKEEEDSIVETIKLYESNRIILQQREREGRQGENNKQKQWQKIKNMKHSTKQNKFKEKNSTKQIQFIQNKMQEQYQNEQQLRQKQLKEQGEITIKMKKKQFKKIVENIITEESKYINYRNAQKIVKSDMQNHEKDPEKNKYIDAYEEINKISFKNLSL